MGFKVNQSAALDASVVVAAHPDDEALFFNSIIDKTQKVILCFLGHPTDLQLTVGRERSLREHPLKNISCIGLTESKIFWNVDWHHPVINKFGMQEAGHRTRDRQYRKNYELLKGSLRTHLGGCRNVFTHNPWGEYGHAEHVQVYRVVCELRDEMNFTVWFPNYCSDKSFALMLQYIHRCDSNYMTIGTDKVLGERIRDLYQRNNCWTWYRNWEWSDEESFIQDKCDRDCEQAKEYDLQAHMFPLNMIKLADADVPPLSGWTMREFQSWNFRSLIWVLGRRVRRRRDATAALF